MLRKVLVALGALAAASAVAHAAPLEAYGKLPNIEQAAVSPSGKFIAYIGTNGEHRKLAVQSTADRGLVFLGDAASAKVRDLIWAGDDHLIMTISTTKQAWEQIGRRENFIAYAVDLPKRRSYLLLDEIRGIQYALNTVHGRPLVRVIDGKPVVFVQLTHTTDYGAQRGLFKVNPDTHVAMVFDSGAPGVYDWLIDANGEIVARAAYKDEAGVWKLRLRTPSGDWRNVEQVKAPIETPELVGLSADGKSVLVTEGAGANGWRELSIETAAWGQTVPRSRDEQPIFDPRSERLLGTYALEGDTARYNFFAPQDAAVWRAVEKAFPGDLVTLQSWSDDRTKILVRDDSPELGPAYAIVDLSTGKADFLGLEYVGLKAEDISARRPVRYLAADGLEITGYLTLPRGRDPHGLPLVVLPHGGPEARDTPGFDWWAEALASRGYAVLQPNFRGSSGLGDAFVQAGYGQWGRKMQTDLSDGVRDLARQGVIDPKRVCIVGANYGGYAALAGVTIQHGVYRCAVALAGVSDLRDGVSGAWRAHISQRYWMRFIGSQNSSDPVLSTYSPLARAAEAEAPILLIHGRDDTVVPIAHSRRMADALKAAGKPVELVELPGEDHWLSRGETRLQMLQATVAFLEKNNPPN